MLRRLLNIASIVCLVLCVALMGLWVRSYASWDQLRGQLSAYYGFAIYTRPGRLVLVECGQAWQGWQWEVSRGPNRYRMDKDEVASPSANLGFAKSIARGFCNLQIPFWFLAFTSGSLALLFRLRWPVRFTLRGLFIATTFLAVVLGMIAWLDRAWIGK
jgi:hypothetical protein